MNLFTCWYISPWSDCLRGGHLIMKVNEIQVSILLSTEQKTWKNNSLSDSHCWPHAFLVFFFYRLWYNAHLSHTGEYIKDPQGLNYFISESEPFSLYWQVWRPGALIICLITLSTTLPVSAMLWHLVRPCQCITLRVPCNLIHRCLCTFRKLITCTVSTRAITPALKTHL